LSIKTINGLIITSYGLNFIVEAAGRTYTAVSKSKKTNYVVGDIVELSIINDDQAQIVKLLPRHNLVMRADKNRSKIIASNIDQLLIVIAIKPNCNPDFLNRCLIFAESQDIHPIIIINKTDLAESAEFVSTINALYRLQLGYQTLAMSAIKHCEDLLPLIKNKKSLLISQSGMGKSTIINTVIPNAKQITASITKAATSGKHTTTNTTLYHMDNNSYIIDCPGLQEFGLNHLNINDITHYFPECRELIGQCKFRNCRHLNEPNCAIVDAYNQGLINPQRFGFLHRLLASW
jgi:ribosome biogenesis GTPase